MKYDLETLMMVIDTLDRNASGYRLVEETSEDKTIKHSAGYAVKALEGMAVYLSKLMAQMILDDARQNSMECVECVDDVVDTEHGY